MDCLPGVEIPVLLQLHKWPPSQFELNLSEFREAFMSPTRELLLLLSYQCEALLLPLVKEDSICGDISENHNAGLQTQSSGAFRSETSTETCRFQRSNNYRFLCDVNSLAWGVCGDTYNHHEEASFRELLFVSSSRGVTVHAFCEPDKANTTTKFTVGDEFEQGRWVDWGPLSSSQSAQETFSFASEGSDTGQAVNTANGNGKNPQYLCEENGDAKFSRGSSPKTWLRSFFTKAETRDSNGKIWTKFPEKASFPCSAEVVSFSILDSGLPFVGFHSPGDSIRHDAGSQHQTHLHPESDAVANKCDGVSDNFGAGSYKCMRVFSSNSHHLIGFVLTLIDCVPEDGANGSQRSEKIIILVARVNSWGIQWVSFVNLAGSLVDLVTEWSDFCFSDNLLVCLKASGLIHFYDSISGDFVAHIDILQVCGLSPHLGIQHDERVFEVPGSQSKQVNSYGKEFHQNGDFLGRINFRKLLSTSHTSLLAVVDEHGSTYVMCAGRYLPDKYYAYENFFHHLQNLGLGMLIGWEVGGSHIGHQRVHSTPIKNRNGSFLDYARKSVQSGELNGKNAQGELHMSGFSAVSNIAAHMSCGSEVHLHLIRKVFLPTERANKDDYVYFSSLGVTRLIKNKSEKNRSTRVVHFNLHKDSVVYDDTRLNFEEKVLHLQGSKEAPLGDAVGCTFQGCFYLVTEVGVSVVLPSMFVASDFLPVETLGYRQHRTNTGLEWEAKGILHMEKAAELFSPWKAEVLDRILLYEGPEEADRICLENGWGLKVSRLRRLQLAMDHLKFDEIEQSLEMLVGINLAEEGILRLLMAAVYLMFHKNGNDNDVSAAARLLTLATCFATKLIRKYGLLEHKKGAYLLHGLRQTPLLALPPITPDVAQSEMCDSERLHDMARLLEIIRNLQCRLTAKYKKPGQGLVDGEDTLNVRDAGLSQDESQLPMLTEDVLMPETRGQEIMFSDSSELALLPKDSREPGVQLDSEVANGVSILVTRSDNVRNSVIPLENPKEMIARWKLDNLDLKTVVKDALQSGRLPLAVLQLHLYRSRDSDSDNEPADTFSEVRNVGRAIAYDLFLKGETGLAVATLQRLGEDIETCLKQLLLGTVRRSLRIQVADEMKSYGFLGPYEWQILEKILLIERLYPSTSFWRTFLSRQKALTIDPSAFNTPGQIKLILLPSPLHMNLTVECGEIDGVVLGSWTGIIENSPDSMIDEDAAHSGYWAAAAVWSCAWDQRTIDRIVLDQPFLMGVHTFWESQLEYYLCHNDWEEVSKLLDLIPTSVLRDGNLQITLDGVQHAPAVGCSSGFPKYSNYISSIEEIDSVCMDVPGVKIFRFSVNVVSSMWLMSLLERELAKKLIFLKEYWEDTAEIVSLLSRSGFMTSRSGDMALEDYSVGSLSDISDGGISRTCAMQALHKLIIHHCVQYNLPNLMDLYLDHQNLALDNESISTLQEAAGDCEWGKWLLLSRIRGHEYDASFCNARSIASRNLTPKSKLNVLEMSEIIHTVDDIAEGGYEMAALATLMHSSDPIKNCLNRGSVKRHSSSSAQCTLENLRPSLQHYPTLWRTLVAASLGEDATSFFVPKETNALSDYLNWRDNIFFSSSHDTSLLQMLPCWFPKTLRRLIQLYIQGPFGWQSLSGLPVADSFSHRELDFYIHADEHTEINAVSWEATVQKHVQDELYDSSLKETGLGLEHHLHRGRALAAFNHILGVRVEGMKSNGLSGTSLGQANVQLDVQKLLAPLTQDEEALLLSVIPHAITHFEDSVLVTSCSFLWELCGLSASMLRVDVASLRRISSFYKLNDNNGKFNLSSPTDTKLLGVSHEGDMVASLARSLADEYLHKGTMFKGTANPLGIRQSSRAVMLVLQHLEKASLPQMMDGKTCGSWLLTGDGDGAELRSQQKAASQHWNLVSLFCQMHQLPLSTKYLAVLAKDNDWVGFLSEAQVGGYPFDTVVQVAAKEFSDQRLKIHVLTVLKGMHSKKMAGSPSASDTGESRSKSSWLDESAFIPVEFFRILADCEKEKNPGESLLKKAKEMSWSILAMVASCFTDVSPLSCLTVWLEITAARETSSIKVNDIATQIADNVGAAVEATNSLPAGSKAPTFHYNRQNPKRRRLMEHMALDALIVNADVGATSIATEDERKQEAGEHIIVSIESDEAPASLSKMVALLCEQQLFIPLLRAFEMFLPSCSLLPFIRALQAFSQMRLAEASAHLGSFSARIKDEPSSSSLGRELREGQIGASWISSTAAKAANAVLSTCPSPYEKRCLLQLLAATDFGDGGFAAAYYGRLYWKINLAEPPLRKDDSLHLGNEALDDASLLTSLEKNGHWEHARNWARQLEASGGPWKSASHHVTETQAESMVAEWKEFLWDVPEERVALWGHCQTLFIRYSFPPLQAGLFFLKHAEAVEKDLPARELLELLLLALQWLSGMITFSYPVYPMNLLREIETRVWLLAVESEAQVKSDGDFSSAASSKDPLVGSTLNIIDKTASLITKMDNHINATRNKNVDKHDPRESNLGQNKNQALDVSTSIAVGTAKTKRRAKGFVPSRRPLIDTVDRSTDSDDSSTPLVLRNDLQLYDESSKLEMSLSKWEERVGPAELERAVLSLMEFGQITAAKQLQQKLSPGQTPSEFMLVDAALKLAAMSTPSSKVLRTMLDDELQSVIRSHNICTEEHPVDPFQVLESLTTVFTEGNGRGLCRRIVAVVKAANVLGLAFSEAFGKQPIELLQLLSLKAQESFDEASHLVQTHSMPPANIAQILAESFLKGLLAAHRGGYMDSQKEEGPAPLLWRFSDFLKWAELCPSESEIGHALMRLVITGQEIPHACEVELLILSHHFYKSSACLDGVDVLVALAATRVEAYVSEGDFPCLARLITGVGNFHALNFILGILIENGQLDLLLQKYSAAADTNAGTAEAVRGFRMAVLTSLKHFNPKDLDAFAMVYNHFDMKHETAALLESRAWQSSEQWFRRYDRDQNEDLLDSMRYFIEAAEVHSSIDAGNKTHKACAQASLVSLQIRMPDVKWLNLSETKARRLLVEQTRFQEALIVAEAYALNQPGEWALVLWNQMLKPELTEEFMAEFVAVLPLQPSMLTELARFYRAEVAARGDQSHFSVWLTGGGLPAEWAKYLGRSFRCLLKRTRDLRLRLQLATVATGFGDILDACSKDLDKVPDSAGPLVLRRGHGGAYLPLM